MRSYRSNSLLGVLLLPVRRFSKAFGEWIVVDLQFRDLNSIDRSTSLFKSNPDELRDRSDRQ